MKPVDVIAKWKARLQEFARVRAHIDGAVLCREALQDFAAILDEGGDDPGRGPLGDACTGTPLARRRPRRPRHGASP